MNTHITLYSPALASAAPAYSSFLRNPLDENSRIRLLASRLKFRKITSENMPEVWSLLRREPGRTTDFSYGGLLMWVDYFHYEYAVADDTLFIKGRVESDVSRVAFSLPVGKMPLADSVAVLKEYCRLNDLQLVFSAVPEYALDDFRALSPTAVEELTDWADYLYDAAPLATLRGKKMSKKRNHVNQFLATYPGYTYADVTPADVPELLRFMDSIDAEGDQNEMAVTERALNREMLGYVAGGDSEILGGVLRDADGRVLAFTLGDIKGDTLFVHIEKALREVPGGFEMINKSFAERICTLHPEIAHINREDDAGDPGLRYAKQSYHPSALLRKYNIGF